MSVTNFDKLEKKQISKTIENIIEAGFNIDTSSDKEFLEKAKYSWDDLNKLKDDLCSHIVQFIAQVREIIINKDIIENLGDKREHFNKIVELFFTDINNFSFKVKELRDLHEHKSGLIDNMTDFNNYNRIAIQYQSLFSELATLITPTIADLMMLVTEIAPSSKANDTTQALSNQEAERTIQ